MATVSVSADHSILTVAGISEGGAVITVTARDGSGGMAEAEFGVEVAVSPRVESASYDATTSLLTVTFSEYLDHDATDYDAIIISSGSANLTFAQMRHAAGPDTITVAINQTHLNIIGVQPDLVIEGDAVSDTAGNPIRSATHSIARADTTTPQDESGSGQPQDTLQNPPQDPPDDTSEPASVVERYDTDGNGTIDHQEWLRAIDDYENNLLTNEEIHAIIRARS